MKIFYYAIGVLTVFMYCVASSAKGETYPGQGTTVVCTWTAQYTGWIALHEAPGYIEESNGMLSLTQQGTGANQTYYRNNYVKYWYDIDTSTWKQSGNAVPYQSSACTVANVPVDPPEPEGDPCQETYDYMAEQCGGTEFVKTIDLQECIFACTACEEKYNELSENCPYGYVFDPVNCTGRCRDCLDYSDDCQKQCTSHNGVAVEDCTFDDSTGFNATCVCKDEYEPPILDNSSDPGATPDDTPTEPDPTLPDPDTSDPWSAAIKKNLDNLISQGNDQKNQLGVLNENVAKGVDNQSKLADAINSKIGQGNESLESIDNKLGKVLDKMDEGEEGNIGPYPGDIEFDENADPDGMYDFDQYSDEETIGQTSAEGEISSLETSLENTVYPIPAQITATGQACLNGTVTIHGNPKQLAICFDKPWMEQGYAIMRLILIGIGYLQSIILLNKSLLA